MGNFKLPPQNVPKFEPMRLSPLDENPLNSILMANHNYAEFIGEAIESVLNQTYSNWELIICDDGSTDNSVKVVENYCRKDNRIKLITKENGGQASAFNAAYEISNGEIISFLDSDDTFFTTKLEQVVNKFKEDYSVGFCIHKVLPINIYGKQVNKPIPQNLCVGFVGPQIILNGAKPNIPPTTGLSFRREILNLIFPIPLEFNIKAADGIICDIAQLISSVTKIDIPLSRYRLHSQNYTARILEDFPNEECIRNGDMKIEAFISTVKQLLLKNFGKEIAESYDFTKRPDYIETRLALYFLRSKPNGGVNGYRFEQLVSSINNKYRRLIWRMLNILPLSVAVRLLKIWWAPSSVKKYLTFISRYISY